jgi:hypothetical protein
MVASDSVNVEGPLCRNADFETQEEQLNAGKGRPCMFCTGLSACVSLFGHNSCTDCRPCLPAQQ